MASYFFHIISCMAWSIPLLPQPKYLVTHTNARTHSSLEWGSESCSVKPPYFSFSKCANLVNATLTRHSGMWETLSDMFRRGSSGSQNAKYLSEITAHGQTNWCQIRLFFMHVPGHRCNKEVCQLSKFCVFTLRVRITETSVETELIHKCTHTRTYIHIQKT